MTRTNNRAKSAQNRSTRRVNNRRAAAEKTAEKITIVDAAEVEAIEVESVPSSLPVAANTDNCKVSSKDVLKAAGSLRSAVKEERRGANVTIRLVAERAAAGDTAAVNILCALCDVPRAALFTLNLDKVRAAVNAYFPYYIETEGRKISVKPAGVWYSTANEDEAQEAAAKRVQRGYIAAAVVDYLDQLILAAKCRAKGVTPRRVDAEAVYEDLRLSVVAEGITAAEIGEAKHRRAYSAAAVNVWKKDRNGFYI